MGIIMRGDNNSIKMNCSEDAKERIFVSIHGNNNQVIIEEQVEIAERLKIDIVDNDNYVHIGRGTTFEDTGIAVADEKNYVKIGEDCMFARETNIIASDFHSIISLATGQRKNIPRNGVIIDNHVWIGYGAKILKNVHIYANSIIGAGMIVSSDVLSNEIYSFSSVHKKREEVTWERQRILERSSFIKRCDNAELPALNRINVEKGIVFNIENDIKGCFNRIQGWAFWRNMDSSLSELFLRCIFGKGGGRILSFLLIL